MFGVLIVDDEEPVLESYEFMLNHFTEGDTADSSAGPPALSPFTVAGKARTGYEALTLIHETGPDLVFMDINIPGIDGLAVLEDVHKKYPRMVCVLSTAYERFDLARRAIPLGVFAYLVKPVSKKTFFSTLENALKELRSRPPETQDEALFGVQDGTLSGAPHGGDPRKTLFRRDIWAAMDKQRWKLYQEALGLPSEKGLVFLVEADKSASVPAASGSPVPPGSREDWGERIAEALSYKYHCTCDVMLNRGLFLVSGDINPAVFREKTEKLLPTLLESFSWVCGFGGLYPGPELYHSCNEALAELSGKHRDTDAWSRAGKSIALLRQKIGFVPREEIKALFAAVWEPLFAEDFETAKIRMVSLFTLLVDDIFGVWSGRALKSGKPETAPPKTAPPGTAPFPAEIDPAEIMELSDRGAWKRWAEHNFDKLVLEANLERQGNYPLPLVKAMAYVRDNYSRGIQLGDAAEAAGVAPAHISRLFTEHLKVTFIDYLTELRITEAERLLRAGSTVREAAYASGYQDPNYFGKTFKKIRGILPTELS